MSAVFSPDSGGRTLLLGELVEHLGRHTVAVLGPADLARPVLGTEFYDALDELPDEPGTLLIVSSGTRLDSAELSRLAATAAQLRYAALALKCRQEHLVTLSAISETSGMPILRVEERVGWRLFEAQLGRLLGEQRRAEDAHFDRGAEPLFALANELAEFFGGSVAIEDLGRRIVAYSSVPGQLIDPLRTSGILARRASESPHNDDQYRSVIRSPDPIKYPQLDDEHPRVAFAIRAGALPLGTIWAIDAAGEAPLTEQQRVRIQSAAAVAAAHMLDDIRVREAGQVPREDRFRTLLTGTGVVGSELIELGIPEDRGAHLLAFDPGRDVPPAMLAQLRSTVQRHLSLYRPESVTVAQGGRVYTLITHDSADHLERLTAPLLPIIARLVGPGVLAAAAGETRQAGGVAQLRERADWLFEAAGRLPVDARTHLLTVARLRPQLLLERFGRLLDAEPVLSSDAVDRLVTEQPAVAEALLLWCEAFGNVTRAAAAAGVHENTIRGRLRKAEERFGLNLADPDTLLVTWVQLRTQVVQKGTT